MAGPKAKVLGSINGVGGRDAGCYRPNAVVIGPKAKDVEGTGVETKIGLSFLCDAIGPKIAVGVGGGMRRVDAGWWMAGGTAAGVCDEDGVISVHASAPIVSLYFFISLSWLPPFSFSPSFGGWEADGVMPVGASAPFAFSGIDRSFHLIPVNQRRWSRRVVVAMRTV